MLKVLWNPKALLCVREKKSVCDLIISMTFCPKLLIFYVQHVVFCKMTMDCLKRINTCVEFVLYTTIYVLVSTIVSKMPIMHQQMTADERHFNHLGEAEISRGKYRKWGNKENNIMSFDTNSTNSSFSQCTLLSFWGIQRNCIWLQPRVLSGREWLQREKRSQRHQSDANYWGFLHIASKLQFHSTRITLTWCL